MSSTNKTTNYELSQFLGSDKPAWLVDYNGDMLKIDTQMKANADAATAAQTKANTADGKADTNAGAIQTLDTEINGVNGLASDLSNLGGTVNTITSLIGNGEPTTTDKTLIGAINELNADINGEGGTEAKIGDLTNLTTTEKSNLVGAINEVENEVSGKQDAIQGYIITSLQKVIEITADGVKTFSDLFTEAATALLAAATALDNDETIKITGATVQNVADFKVSAEYYLKNNSVQVNASFDTISVGTTITLMRYVRFSTAASNNRFLNTELTATPAITFNNNLSSVPTSGSKIYIQSMTFKEVG